MIDLQLLRENPESVIKRITVKDPAFPIQRLIDLETQVRHLRQEVEVIRAEKNRLAHEAKTGITDDIRTRSKLAGASLKEKEEELKQLEVAFDDLYLHCPNLPADDLPLGNKESNKVVSTYGEKKHFDFPLKTHLELGEALGWFDFKAAAAMTGSQFALYRNTGVDLVYALTHLMYRHNKKHGFSPVLPPYLVNERTLTGASNLPRFKNEVYKIQDEDLYLTPTAEVNLSALYRDRILTEEQLPIRLTAWTSCFRREAGGYGSTERGLIRIHQFEKVELYTLCTPEEADAEQKRMLACAEEFLQKLGLHYRVSLLAGQDCSFASAKTYDIEVWMPGQGEYKEVSSISNCTDFQSRRCSIRYRKNQNDKTHLVHTLNGSSLALPRVMVALMETYQQEDGSIALPKILTDAID